MSTKYIVLTLFVLLGNIVNGQSKIQIVDSATNETLVGASILCHNGGTVSDFEGYFLINDVGSCDSVIVSYIGYETQAVRLDQLGATILMRQDVNSLDLMTVTGSRYQKRLSETTVSVDVIKPGLISSINATSSSSFINKMPGVQIVGGQANIRGGSGFSYGAGSRVMVLLDDVPAMQADAGYVNWSDMPIENLGQVEIVKGAASTLYGSSALNGIINFKRATPTTTPKIKIFTSFTKYLDPEEPKSIWWGDTLRYNANVGFSILRKVGKMDVSIHGFANKLESYARSSDGKKGRFGADLKYHWRPNLNLGVNYMVNYHETSDFFIWRNALRGHYEPYPGTISSGKRLRMMIDPYLNYTHSNGDKHKINTRIFYTNNDNNNNQGTKSTTIYGEYQYQKKITNLDLVLTTGIASSFTNTESQLFGDSTFNFTNAATYLQLEKKQWDILSLSGGIRYEYNLQTGPEFFQGFEIPNGRVDDGQWIARLGANVKISKSNNIRMSWGQGYRYPTVTERFIRTDFGGLSIFPNPLLDPEYGWSAEIGMKQRFTNETIKGFLDLSAFVSEYEDMIEFSFLEDPFGFQPINIGNTRISGFEASMMGQIKLGPVPMSLLTGYTFIEPKYKNFEGNDILQANISTSKNVLKYRSKHSFKIDGQWDYRGFSLGLAWQYYSHMVNIDKRLELPLGGQDLFDIKFFREQNNRGYDILNARISYKFKNYKLSFLMNNINNNKYTIRPGLLEAPKNVSCRFDAEF